MLGKILEKVFITKKFTECKTSRNLKFEVIEMPDKKNIGKFFSKYELLFQLWSISNIDTTISIPRTSLPPLPSLSHLTLANWNSSSTQSSSWSVSVSLFCPTILCFCAKHATHQKSESLRSTFLSNLDNMDSDNSIFNT